MVLVAVAAAVAAVAAAVGVVVVAAVVVFAVVSEYFVHTVVLRSVSYLAKMSLQNEHGDVVVIHVLFLRSRAKEVIS